MCPSRVRAYACVAPNSHAIANGTTPNFGETDGARGRILQRHSMFGPTPSLTPLRGSILVLVKCVTLVLECIILLRQLMKSVVRHAEFQLESLTDHLHLPRFLCDAVFLVDTIFSMTAALR